MASFTGLLVVMCIWCYCCRVESNDSKRKYRINLDEMAIDDELTAQDIQILRNIKKSQKEGTLVRQRVSSQPKRLSAKEIMKYQRRSMENAKLLVSDSAPGANEDTGTVYDEDEYDSSSKYEPKSRWASFRDNLRWDALKHLSSLVPNNSEESKVRLKAIQRIREMANLSDDDNDDNNDDDLNFESHEEMHERRLDDKT